MTSEDTFREDILEQLFVEEITSDLSASADALEEAYQITMYLSDLLGAAAQDLPSGDLRSQVRSQLNTTHELMVEVGNTKRAVRLSPR